jgi:hypothetical protein
VTLSAIEEALARRSVSPRAMQTIAAIREWNGDVGVDVRYARVVVLVIVFIRECP